MITISRQWGSGGTNIAKLVAKKLDFKLYDKEIIEHIAELAGASPSQIEHHDESDPGVFSDRDEGVGRHHAALRVMPAQ